MSPVELTSDMRRRSSEKRAISRPRRKSATHKKGCRTRRPSATPLTSGALPSGRRRDGGSVSRKKRLTSATTLRPSAHEQPYARRTERDARLPPTKVDAAKPRPRAAEMRDCSIARRVALRPSVSARLAWKESQKIGTDADVTKRATITFPFSGTEVGGTGGSETGDWTYQGQNKCCRELHLYLEDGKLKCTAIVRMQNANIFVKNIHFFATLIEHVSQELGGVEVGEYTHWITNLCYDRDATSC